MRIESITAQRAGQLLRQHIDDAEFLPECIVALEKGHCGEVLNVPVVEDLDAKILARITAAPESFHMSDWHTNREGTPVVAEAGASTCGTTHCRAGHAIELAGAAGYALERAISPAAAGGLIYILSTGRHPDFYSNTETALADIRRCAAVGPLVRMPDAVEDLFAATFAKEPA
jgi:hypothetical protein